MWNPDSSLGWPGPFGKRSAAHIGIGWTVALILCGCSTPTALPKVTPVDQQVAAESAALIEKALQELPDDHPLIQRYGRFVSMTLTRPVRENSQKAWLGPGGLPAHLRFRLPCMFEKFPAKMEVTVFNYNTVKQPEFFYQPNIFVLMPSPDIVQSGVLSDCVPTVKDDELWYIRESGDHLEAHCTVECWIQHPKFVP